MFTEPNPLAAVLKAVQENQDGSGTGGAVAVAAKAALAVLAIIASKQGGGTPPVKF